MPTASALETWNKIRLEIRKFKRHINYIFFPMSFPAAFL